MGGRLAPWFVGDDVDGNFVGNSLGIPVGALDDGRAEGREDGCFVG